MPRRRGSSMLLAVVALRHGSSPPLRAVALCQHVTRRRGRVSSPPLAAEAAAAPARRSLPRPWPWLQPAARRQRVSRPPVRFTVAPSPPPGLARAVYDDSAVAPHPHPLDYAGRCSTPSTAPRLPYCSITVFTEPVVFSRIALWGIVQLYLCIVDGSEDVLQLMSG